MCVVKRSRQPCTVSTACVLLHGPAANASHSSTVTQPAGSCQTESNKLISKSVKGVALCTEQNTVVAEELPVKAHRQEAYKCHFQPQALNINQVLIIKHIYGHSSQQTNRNNSQRCGSKCTDGWSERRTASQGSDAVAASQ